MSLLSYLRTPKKGTAQTAKERLQVVIAHQRTERSRHPFLPELQQDLLEVIRRYFPVENDQVQVQLEREGDCEILELNVTLPDT